MITSVTTDRDTFRQSAHLQQGKVSQLVDVDDETSDDVMVTGRRV